MKDIKNIIFDLGGVIIDLDMDRTIQAFNMISTVPFEEIYSQSNQIELFNEFDKGKLSDYDFFKQLRQQIRFEGPDEDLLFAWNAMLLDVPEERLELLVDAKQDYNTFLLSNTCEPHISTFESELYQKHGVKNFNDYFDGVYYSCRVGMRKPDREIFEMVLQKNKLLAQETVFIDDSVQHVKGAGECGINAYLLPKNMEVADLLAELNLL
ncbi:MAG: HAD family phosphatase [bacterium]|nr:HAD family phosphatase [bacterium]